MPLLKRREILKQVRFHPSSLEDEILSFLILESEVLDGVDVTATRKVCDEMLAKIKGEFPDIVARIANDGRISNTDLKRLRDFLYSLGRG